MIFSIVTYNYKLELARKPSIFVFVFTSTLILCITFAALQKSCQGNLVSYFLNNAAKTCLYGTKILENIEIRHVFQPRAFFHHISILHTSCLSTFNERISELAHFLNLAKWFWRYLHVVLKKGRPFRQDS